MRCHDPADTPVRSRSAAGAKLGGAPHVSTTLVCASTDATMPHQSLGAHHGREGPDAFRPSRRHDETSADWWARAGAGLRRGRSPTRGACRGRGRLRNRTFSLRSSGRKRRGQCGGVTLCHHGVVVVSGAPSRGGPVCCCKARKRARGTVWRRPCAIGSRQLSGRLIAATDRTKHPRKEERVPARGVADRLRAAHGRPRLRRQDVAGTSRDRRESAPTPRTTQVMGSSSRWIGRARLLLQQHIESGGSTRRPPVITIPRSTMSDASSGGVISSARAHRVHDLLDRFPARPRGFRSSARARSWESPKPGRAPSLPSRALRPPAPAEPDSGS